MRMLFGFLLLAAMQCSCGRSEVRATPTAAALCTVTIDPAAFDDRFVTMRASVTGDGHHGVFLNDRACRGRGIAIGYVEGIQNRSRLDDAIYRTGMRGTVDKEITATFTGTIRWNPDRWWRRARDRRDPLLMLEAEQIDDLAIKPKPLHWNVRRYAASTELPAVGKETASSLAGTIVSMTIDDIRLNATPFGLWPATNSKRGQQIQAAGATAVPLLQEALEDPWRYVAAHVFLTWASDRPVVLSPSEFNGLSVTRRPDGRLSIPDQRKKIRSMWSDEL